VLAACRDLTMQMARDAAGMTRIAHLTFTGAHSTEEARIAAKNIVENNLVKCSWYGGDPYWGRLLGAAGSAGIEFDPDRSEVSYGGILVSRAGTNFAHDAEAVAAHMKQDLIDIEVALGLGKGSARVIGIDLGPGYIKENSKTS
jgi:glutamate N-acetyltransferase/amino-acid N-acetyltransferase